MTKLEETKADLSAQRFMRQVKKKHRQLAWRPQTKPHNVLIKIRILCEEYGKPEYYVPLCNQLLKRIHTNIDNGLASHLHVAADDPTDIAIDIAGLVEWKALLLNYFAESFLTELYEDAIQLKEDRRNDFELQQVLQGATTKELKRFKAVNPILDDLIKQELERRRSPKMWLRKLCNKVAGHSEGVYL